MLRSDVIIPAGLSLGTVTHWLCLAAIVLGCAGAARSAARCMGLFSCWRDPRTWIALLTLTVSAWLVGGHVLGGVAEFSRWPVVGLPAWAVLSIGLYIGLRILERSRVGAPLRAYDGVGSWPARPMVWWWIAPVIGLHAVLFIDAILRPPSGYDGLYYHLPLMLRWLRSGTLGMYLEADEFCYVGNCEVWQLPMLAVGSEALVNISQIPIGLLLAASVYGVARELGGGRTGSTFAGLAALSCPMVACQMYSTYVDMFGSAFTVAGLYWVLRMRSAQCNRREQLSALLMTGLCIGIANGAKMSFVPWSVCLSVLAVLFVLADRRAAASRHGSALGVLPAAALFTVGVSMCSGFWYVRNAVNTGWFLYPFEVRIAGMTLGSGRDWEEVQTVIQRPYAGLQALGYPWVEWQDTGRRYAEHYGLGPVVATFAAVGGLWLLWLCTQRSRLWPSKHAARVAVLALAVVGVVLFIGLFGSDARYALPMWVALLPAIALPLNIMLRWRPRSTHALGTISLVLAAAMITLWPAKTLAGRVHDGDLSRAHAYEIPKLFDTLAPETVVLNLGTHAMNYPLCGASLQNRVFEKLLVTSDLRARFEEPISRETLSAQRVEIVYARDRSSAPFAADVRYVTLYDDAHDPRRPPSTTPTQVYRILQH